MIQQWLTLVLDLVAGGLALIVTGLAVKLRDVVSPGFTGVALVQIIGFNITLQSLVMWCESRFRRHLESELWLMRNF
jgi:ATP-binding cassette, subfamily C (CFTR/MRP), member 1